MSVLSRLTSPWAIHPDSYEVLWSIYQKWERGEKAIEFDEPVRSEVIQSRKDDLYDAVIDQNGIGIVPVVGSLAKKMNMLTRMSGGMSMEMIESVVETLAEDRTCKAMILVIDSPGGEVAGTQSLAQAVLRARDKKKVVAIVDGGMMCSAALWIGTAAAEVYATVETTCIGSIGVVARHVDVSLAENMEGYKTTLVTSGKYKAEPSPYAPLSQEGKDLLQAEVDAIAQEFISDVTAFRNVEKSTIMKSADGRTWLGSEAVRRGLIDGVKPWSEIYNQLLTSLSAGSRSAATKEAIMSGTTAQEHAQVEESTDTTAEMAVVKHELEQAKKANEELQASNNTLAEQMEAQKKAVDEAKAQAAESVVTAVAEERTRVSAILELGADYPEHQNVIAKCIADGTQPGDTSTQILKAEAKAKKNRIEEQDNDAPAPVPDVHSSTTPSAEDGDFDKQVARYQKDNPEASYKDAVLEISKKTNSLGE